MRKGGCLQYHCREAGERGDSPGCRGGGEVGRGGSGKKGGIRNAEERERVRKEGGREQAAMRCCNIDR